VPGKISDAAGELRIRAHHGLCIRFFCGHGYSPAFTANMERTIARLHAGEPFVLADGLDSLCACCPNNSGTVCTSEEKVRRYDAAVQDLCGVHPGDRLTWPAFSAAVASHILNAGKFSAVCGDCSWRQLCHKEVQ